MNPLKNHIFCVLSERLLLFSVDSYTKVLALDALDFLYDWQLLENGQLKGNVRCLNEYLIEKITQTKEDVENYALSHNMRVFYCNFESEFGEFAKYLEDPIQFAKKVQRYCKKHLCGGKIIPILSQEYLYKFVEYEGMKCLNLSGEQMERILKKMNKKRIKIDLQLENASNQSF